MGFFFTIIYLLESVINIFIVAAVLTILSCYWGLDHVNIYIYIF